MSSTSQSAVFLTGASGFVGRSVLASLLATQGPRVVCLARDPAAFRASLRGADGVDVVEGDLEAVDDFAPTLAHARAVVHLAAATGTAPVDLLERVNVEGTRALLAASRRHAVPHFVYMSSIAADGADLSGYPYAQSKRAAERAVRESGMGYSILRPTIVLGETAPNWPMLRKLACLPVVPLIGGGRARVQPIDVADVARAVQVVLAAGPTGTIDLGGPEALSFSELLRRIRAACGRRGFPRLSVPAAPIRVALTLARSILGDRLPVTPAQLNAFVMDGVAAPNAVQTELAPGMSSLDELLRRISHVR